MCGVLPLVLIKSLLFGRTLTSLPFLNYGGVLAADEGRAAQALVDAAAEQARARSAAATSSCATWVASFRRFPCKQHKVAMLLRLAGVDWSSLDRKVRNQIRKAEKSGLTVQTGRRRAAGRLLHGVRPEHARPGHSRVRPRRSSRRSCSTFPARRVFTSCGSATMPVAGGFTVRSRPRLEIPWASSVRDYNTLCPNHLLYWRVIQHAIETGL